MLRYWHRQSKPVASYRTGSLSTANVHKGTAGFYFAVRKFLIPSPMRLALETRRWSFSTNGTLTSAGTENGARQRHPSIHTMTWHSRRKLNVVYALLPLTGHVGLVSVLQPCHVSRRRPQPSRRPQGSSPAIPTSSPLMVTIHHSAALQPCYIFSPVC